MICLDEAIKHAEEVAEENEKKCTDGQLWDVNESRRKRAEEHRQLAEWLKELKQLREQTGWIPVSERLPKIADVYRVTRYYPNNVMNPNYLVDACCFDGSNTWYNDNRINHDRAYADNVIAWQENHEPYKESEGQGMTREEAYRLAMRACEETWNEKTCKQIREALEQEPKTGHWEWVQYDYNPKLGNWHCSECRCVVVECVNKEEEGGIPLYKYCPQCGAKIVKPQEREEA